MFVPSPYQLAIFDWIKSGRGDGVVDAVAGSGKSTTLVEAAKLLRGSRSLFVAFNKHIADELNNKLKSTGMEAKTVHSIGYGACARAYGRLRVENKKYTDLARAFMADNPLPTVWVDGAPVSGEERARQAATSLAKLADLARLTLTDPADDGALFRMCNHYDVLPEEEVVTQGLPIILREGERLATAGVVDFTDMIYLPVKNRLPLPAHGWVFVDECQDLNACQLELVLRLRAPGGRMLFVGDPRQAIMGFAGADAESFRRIQRRTAAQSLPLSICYRCPSSHLDMARSLVPQIEARPDAPAGEVAFLDKELSEIVQEGDLVVCRVTAPLVRECIRLISQRVPARVRGRDIAHDLCAILRAIGKARGFDYADLPAHLTNYRRSQESHLRAREADESAIEALNDRVEALLTCAAAYADEADSIEALCRCIEGLFSDERASIWLSTIHRSKGLEAERVILIEPKKLPLVWKDQLAWQYEQELNLKYVALTRAKRALIIVGGDPRDFPAFPQLPARGAEAEAEAA